MNKDKEIARLKRKLRRWQKLYEWEGMARAYHPNVAQVNLGNKPKVPSYES